MAFCVELRNWMGAFVASWCGLRSGKKAFCIFISLFYIKTRNNGDELLYYAHENTMEILRNVFNVFLLYVISTILPTISAFFPWFSVTSHTACTASEHALAAAHGCTSLWLPTTSFTLQLQSLSAWRHEDRGFFFLVQFLYGFCSGLTMRHKFSNVSVLNEHWQKRRTKAYHIGSCGNVICQLWAQFPVSP